MNDTQLADEKLEQLTQLSALVAQRMAADRDFKRAVGSLKEDVDYIAEGLRRDPVSWRSNRAFHAVHVPSLIAVIAVLEDVDAMASVTPDAHHQIMASLHQAVALARDARGRLEQAALNTMKTELDVLSSYAPAPAEPYKKPSLLSRAVGGVSSASETMWDGVKSGTSSVPGLAAGLQGGVADAKARITTVPLLADNLRKMVSGTVYDTVAAPVQMRLKAGQNALSSGVQTGVGLGVVVGILCPPLLPVTAGGAVLAAMRTWRVEMERAEHQNAQERDARIAALSDERVEFASLSSGIVRILMSAGE